MAKKKVIEQVKRARIICKEFTGYIDEMPQEAKDAIAARNPKAAKLFENK